MRSCTRTPCPGGARANNCRDATPPLGIVPDIEDALHFHFADRFHHAGTVDRATGQFVHRANNRGLRRRHAEPLGQRQGRRLVEAAFQARRRGQCGQLGPMHRHRGHRLRLTGMIMSKSFRRTASSSGTRRIKPSDSRNACRGVEMDRHDRPTSMSASCVRRCRCKGRLCLELASVMNIRNSCRHLRRPTMINVAPRTGRQ